MTGTGGARPLSTRIAVSAIPAEGVEIAIVATEAERAALASAFGLDRLDRLEARLDVRRWRKQGAVAEGRLEASLVQTCVVSLDPFASEISEEIKEFFWPAADDEAAGGREVVLDVAADEPEPFSGGEIDLGALVADTLSTAIDPYPRKPGATLDELDAGELGDGADDGGKAARSPFAALAGLAKPDPDRD